MERPTNAKSIIRDFGSELKIIIPCRWYWRCLYAIGLTIVGEAWFGIESRLAEIIQTEDNPNYIGDNFFIVLFMITITVTLFVAIKYLWFRVLGKEIITITQSGLTIERKQLPFERTKTYNLNEIKNLRWFEDITGYTKWGPKYRPVFKPFDEICFRYKLRAIRFGNDVDQYEAQYIVQLIKDKTGLAFE